MGVCIFLFFFVAFGSSRARINSFRVPRRDNKTGRRVNDSINYCVTCELASVADCSAVSGFVPRIANERSRAPGRVCQYSDEYANIPAADNEAMRTRVDSVRRPRGLTYDVSLRSTYMLVRSSRIRQCQ